VGVGAADLREVENSSALMVSAIQRKISRIKVFDVMVAWFYLPVTPPGGTVTNGLDEGISKMLQETAIFCEATKTGDKMQGFGGKMISLPGKPHRKNPTRKIYMASKSLTLFLIPG
jgi:hypothetical protein